MNKNRDIKDDRLKKRGVIGDSLLTVFNPNLFHDVPIQLCMKAEKFVGALILILAPYTTVSSWPS